jgi:hypothetical protein
MKIKDLRDNPEKMQIKEGIDLKLRLESGFYIIRNLGPAW